MIFFRSYIVISSLFEIKGYAEGFYSIYRRNLKNTFIFKRKRTWYSNPVKINTIVKSKKTDALSI